MGNYVKAAGRLREAFHCAVRVMRKVIKYYPDIQLVAGLGEARDIGLSRTCMNPAKIDQCPASNLRSD
jgi:hypothetical protein